MKKTTIHINPPKKEKSVSSDEKVTSKKKVAASANRLPAILIVITLAIALFVWSALQSRNQLKIHNFETCKKAGYPVMESYPAACTGPNGVVYTEVIQKVTPSVNPTAVPDSNTNQYKSTDPNPEQGSSTPGYHGIALGNCNKDSDCILSGCNKEICQAVGIEPAMSTCEYREDTPLRLGYKCGCVQNKCDWTK